MVAALLVAMLDIAALQAIEKAVPACPEQVAHCYAIQLHVATDNGTLVTSPEFIAGQFAAANHHFAAIDVGFQLAKVVDHSSAKIVTRQDRDKLAKLRRGSPVIDVFIVGELADIDAAGAVINGVTWHLSKQPRKYIIVSAKAWDRTLAHELGHFFGLPHSEYPISIMNKTKRDEPPQDQRTFADEELVLMRARHKRLLRDKVIAPATRR